MATATAYYVADIPQSRSTTRYQHAVAIGQHAPNPVLLSHSDPPSEIASLYDEIHTLDGTQLDHIRQAVQIVNGMNDVTFVTTVQYEPTLAGYLADQRWVCDIYDDPMQGALHSPRSYHQLFSRIRRWLVERSDRRVYTLHPGHPRVDPSDRGRRFALNGAPTEFIDCPIPDFDSPIRFVQVGKASLDDGLKPVLSALSKVSTPVRFDIYGKKRESVDAYIRNAGLESQVIVHGLTPHEEVCRAIENAHFGLCVLPERPDYKFQYPIKIGEYLAAGTVPIASGFWGIREQAEAAAEYTTPTTGGVSEVLEKVFALSKDEYIERAERARSRGEQITWGAEREHFTEQAIGDFEFAP